MAFSDYIAIAALLVSALALFIAWRQYVRDQGHLKLSVRVEDDPRTGPLYVVRAVNEGRRMVTIQGVYARVTSGKAYPVFDTRTTLNETETLEFTVPFAGFFKTTSSGYFIKAFEFEDTTGVRYILKTNHVRRQVESMIKQ